MKLSDLVEQTKLPEEYLTFLKGILDGTEGQDINDEDIQILENIETELQSLDLEEA